MVSQLRFDQFSRAQNLNRVPVKFLQKNPQLAFRAEMDQRIQDYRNSHPLINKIRPFRDHQPRFNASNTGLYGVGIFGRSRA